MKKLILILTMLSMTTCGHASLKFYKKWDADDFLEKFERWELRKVGARKCKLFVKGLHKSMEKFLKENVDLEEVRQIAYDTIAESELSEEAKDEMADLVDHLLEPYKFKLKLKDRFEETPTEVIIGATELVSGALLAISTVTRNAGSRLMRDGLRRVVKK